MKRHCGDCQLCCRLLPTAEIDKPASTKCPHQCRSGCAIYADRPVSCRLWSCQWLIGVDVGQRPDRSHVVVDVLADYVTAVAKTGERHTIAVVQLWIDAQYPDAHRDPALRRWLDQTGSCALVRYSSSDAFLLAPPSYTGEGWFEGPRQECGETEHSVRDKVEALRRAV